jgi:hypothetical protein
MHSYKIINDIPSFQLIDEKWLDIQARVIYHKGHLSQNNFYGSPG